MPYCPTCGGEYPLGQTRCPECDSELVEIQAPPDDIPIEFEGEPVLLCKTGDMSGAELLAQAFAEKSIPCFMNPGPLEFRIFPLEYGQNSIRIFVPESLVDKAREIAQRMLADYTEGKEKDAEDN
jgi:hypothetical protein